MHVSNENCLLIFSLVVPMQKWLFLEKRKMCGIKSAETAMYDVSNKWKKRSSTFKKRRTMNAPPTDKKYERVIKMSSNCYVSVKVANGVFVFSECQKDPGEQFQINDLFERERYWWGKIRWPYEWIFWFRVKWYNDPELKSPANDGNGTFKEPQTHSAYMWFSAIYFNLDTWNMQNLWFHNKCIL